LINRDQLFKRATRWARSSSRESIERQRCGAGDEDRTADDDAAHLLTLLGHVHLHPVDVPCQRPCRKGVFHFRTGACNIGITRRESAHELQDSRFPATKCERIPSGAPVSREILQNDSEKYSRLMLWNLDPIMGRNFNCTASVPSIR
jgi:hypothetical protein